MINEEIQIAQSLIKRNSSQAIRNTKLWKKVFLDYKAVIIHPLPLSRLIDSENEFSFINEDDLLTKDEEMFKVCNLTLIKSDNVNQADQITVSPLNKPFKVMEKPEEPRKPEPDECCGSGCNVCVFDRYYQELEKYEEKLEEWQAYQQSQKNIENDTNNQKKKIHLLDW